MASEPERISWLAAEPARYRREHDAMGAVAPDMEWSAGALSGGWTGAIPVWPFERPSPEGLSEFLAGRRLTVAVVYRESFPMTEPQIFPIDPIPDSSLRALHEWHLNGDGSLCLLRRATDWRGKETAADLVVKASGWFLEYLLLVDGLQTAMTECGIVSDPSLDYLLTGPSS